MSGGKRLARLDPVTDFLVKDDANRKIDGGIFSVAAGAKRFPHQRDFQGIDRGDLPRFAGENGVLHGRGRKPIQVVDDGCIA